MILFIIENFSNPLFPSFYYELKGGHQFYSYEVYYQKIREMSKRCLESATHYVRIPYMET